MSATPTVLIVDDKKVIRAQFASFFRAKGWHAIEASRADQALNTLKAREWVCDCIILDQRMPGMDGLEFLQQLRERQPQDITIHVIVLSAYVATDSDTERSFRASGAAHVFQKPQKPDLLEAVARALLLGPSRVQQVSTAQQAISAHEIDARVQEHEELLEQHFRAQIGLTTAFARGIKEPLLLVARRWNSWYPSYFDVPGGAYTVVFPECRSTRRPRCVVIDPGFRFLRILADAYAVSVRDLEACIVTHNHPDHMGGVFEYIACRHECGQESRFYCNPAAQRMLAEVANASVTASVLPSDGKDEVILGSYEDIRRARRSLRLRTFPTDHREVGWDSDCRGIVLNCSKRLDGEDSDIVSTAVILGDSAYDVTNPNMRFHETLAGSQNTRIAVLHIGSAQIKERIGGHLYLSGLSRLVHQLAEKRAEIAAREKLLVLVSEWGLEHATAEQMKRICPGLDGFDQASAIINTIEFLRYSLNQTGRNQLTILPADIGLAVGIETGLVHLSGTGGTLTRLPAEKVRFRAGHEGIEYSA